MCVCRVFAYFYIRLVFVSLPVSLANTQTRTRTLSLSLHLGSFLSPLVKHLLFLCHIFFHSVHSSCLLHITSSLEMRILCRRSPKNTMMTVRESHPCWITIITIANKKQLNNTASNSNRATFVMDFQLDENFSNKKLRTVGIFFILKLFARSPFLQFIFDTTFFSFASCSLLLWIHNLQSLVFYSICHLLISSPERIAFYFDKSRLFVGVVTCSNCRPLMLPSRMCAYIVKIYDWLEFKIAQRRHQWQHVSNLILNPIYSDLNSNFKSTNAM